MNYNHSLIEKKWQEAWEKDKLYSPDIRSAKKPYYNLMMFPYPSAEGLHVGNMYAFTGTDIHGRFQRMNGFDVFEPIGLDGFGIHSENYAIKVGRHPKDHAKISEEHFYSQLHQIGNGYDWTKKLETYDPEYYKWTQWLFIKMWEKGLAYKDIAMVNWCDSCKTVLSDEQVIDGKCERCSFEVTKKEMSSWFFRITKYADRLLNNIDKINWPERIKTAQRNWIGRSEGMKIKFKVKESDEVLEVFTTRPDTLESVTFLALASKTLPKLEDSKVKLGEKTDKIAINPMTGREVSVWETNYVAGEYGTGVVMGVPAYDERDMDFAIKYSIEILNISLNDELWEIVPKKKWGEKFTNYHLRDWGISRQRYWGPPIPMVKCKDCNWQAVPESELPVVLPDISDFKPKGDGTSPLYNASESWKKTNCPKCGKDAERELDVSDTFLDSSWYFLRFPSLDQKDKPFDPEITKKWLPVNAYIGGAEHAVLHLMYARFVTMVLKDLKLIDFEEPFPFLYGHGLIIKDGAKMSKSKGNIVNPDVYIEKFGADTLRMYLMFLGKYDQGGDFRDSGIEGMSRFLNRVWKLYNNFSSASPQNYEVLSKLHQTIKGVTEDIKQFKYNTAIAKIMELVNVLSNGQQPIANDCLVALCQLLAPFAPHMTEELWQEVLKQNGSVHTSKWPEFDPKYLVESEVTIAIQINGKLRSTITLNSQLSTDKQEVVDKAKNDEKIAKLLNGQTIKKEIFVPNKLVNFVV